MLIVILALRIHLSAAAHAALGEFPGYVTQPRGETFVKVRRILFQKLPTYFVYVPID